MRKGIAALVLLCCLALPGCTSSESPPADVRTVTGAQLFSDLGDYQRTFTTSSEEAHKYLVQGLIWTQAFNYDEATRSFE